MAQHAGQTGGGPGQMWTEDKPVGQVMPFECINEPGAYVCNWSGHLIRVPEDAITPGRSPLVNICGPSQLFVTKISCNPYIPLTKARLVASNFDACVNF